VLGVNFEGLANAHSILVGYKTSAGGGYKRLKSQSDFAGNAEYGRLPVEI